jgi:hypothetical protein
MHAKQSRRRPAALVSFALLTVLALAGLGAATAAHAANAATAANAAAAGSGSPGLLDGKSFAGELGEKGKAKGDKDEFVFKAGTFRSAACDAYGFGDASYRATREGASIAFTAETHSPKEGTMSWSGRVTGDHIEGTVTWAKEGKAPAEYWFRAQLKK